MRCSRCGSEFSGLVCPNCGAHVRTDTLPRGGYCARCGNRVYGPYCIRCGLPVAPPRPVRLYHYQSERKTSDDFGKVVSASWIIYFGVFIAAVIAFLGLLWWGYLIGLPRIIDNSCPDCKGVLLVITPLPVPIINPFGGLPFLLYYFTVVLIISICFFWLFLTDFPRILSDLKEFLSRGWFSHSSRSTLFLIGKLFALGVFFNVGYNLIILLLFGSAAVPSGVEIEPPWYFLAMIATAAVWEEIISRTLLIGIPLLAVALLVSMSKKEKIEKPIRYLVGGGFSLGFFEIVFLIFSAMMFAFAHVFSGGFWVFPPLLFGGLILGYLFLKKGIVTSIFFHFIWNYSIGFTQIGSAYGNYTIIGLGVAFTLFVAFVGLSLTILTLVGIASKRRKGMAEGGDSPSAQERMEKARPAFQCPSCGFTSAVYKDGSFQCLRCGYVIQAGFSQEKAYR